MPRRAVLGQRLSQVVPIAWMLVLVWWPRGDPLATWQRVLAMAVVVAVVAHAGLELTRPPRIELHHDVAVIRGPFRRREVPWRDVRDITRARWTVDLTMHLADGRRARSRYPGDALLLSRRRAAADFETVRLWWLAP
jgi:hypothetical protein